MLFRSGAGATAAAAAVLTGGTLAQAQTAAAAAWRADRHDKDDWMDKPNTKHRLIFDTTSPTGFGESLAFAGNFVRVNQTDYGVPFAQLSVVIVVRHNSTAFGYNDAIWAKYGTLLSLRSGFLDPKTNGAPKTNLFKAADYGQMLPNRGTTLETAGNQGIQIGVCQVEIGRAHV